MADEPLAPLDPRGLPFPHLIGWVVMGSSSLDHTTRRLHYETTATDLSVDDDGSDFWERTDTKTDRSKIAAQMREVWSVWVAHDLLTAEDESAGVDWLRGALDLLYRRDLVVHALWRVDRDLPAGVSGTSPRYGQRAPDYDGTGRLALEVRAHMYDDRLKRIVGAVRAIRFGLPPA